MAKIAVFNQKGGVGKTTTSLNLTAALARRGYNPLSIDLDPQAHLSYVCGSTVGNADDSIKKIAFDVTSSNDDDGVANTLKKYFP